MVNHLKLDLTTKCNLSCGFCPYHGENAQILEKTTLTKNIIKSNIFSEEYSFDSVQISGSGEALLHPDFIDISNYIRRKVEKLSLITNGILLNQHKETIIEKYDKVVISIHGGEKTHNKIVQNDNAYKKAIDGILGLKKKKFNDLKINYVLTHKNLSDVKSIIEFSKNNNIKITFSLDFLPNIDFFKKNKDLLIETIDYIKSNNDGNLIISPNLNNNEIIKFFTEKDYIINPYNCNHPNNAIEIKSNGDVYICRSNSFGNIYEKHLNNIITNNERRNFLKQIKNEMNTTGLTNPRCYHCCYQKPSKDKKSY